MKIGLDFDGVIADSRELKSYAAQEMYGIRVPLNIFKKDLVVDKYLTLDQYRSIQKLIYSDWNWGLKMKPVEGMLNFLPQIIKDHEVTIITSRSGVGLEIAKQWLKGLNLEINFIGLGYGVSKAEASKTMDVYVDDDLEKLEDLSTPKRILFLWDYNKNNIFDQNIIQTTSSWNELNKIIIDSKK